MMRDMAVRRADDSSHAGLDHTVVEKQCRQDKGVSDALILSCQPLVRRIANRIAWRVPGADPEELMQVGLVTLVELAQHCTLQDGDSFRIYVAIRVRGGILDYLRRDTPSSRRTFRARRILEKARATAELQNQDRACHADIAQSLGHRRYLALISASQGYELTSLNAIYSDHDMGFACERPDAFDHVSDQRLREHLFSEISRLSSREAEILRLFFIREWSLVKIGAALGVSAARVCQIKSEALKKLRARLKR